jgi:hypothetical protein
MSSTQVQEVAEELRTKGYALVSAGRLDIDPELRRHERDLAQEWERLETDRYLKGGARFRERRYDRFVFRPSTGESRLRAHVPYYQSGDANEYAGGIQREVAPLAESSLDNPLLLALIPFDFAKFPVAPELFADTWDVQCHQFRIIGFPGELGDPTPEGPHRDEVDFGAIHLMHRRNAEGGESQVYTVDKEFVAEFRLESRMDTMYWADAKILHAVRPITAIDPDQAAIRDVLILGYRHAPELAGELGS